MEILPISIEHASQFSAAIISIAREDCFSTQADSLSTRSAFRFVEQQIVDGAPMFVALENNTVIGWCEVSMSDVEFCRHSGLLSMGVLQGYRGGGVGSWLINKCVSAARSIGFERIELTVLENNFEAKRFYLSKGFIVEGKKLNSLKVGNKYYNEILMALQIPSKGSLDYNL